MSHQQKQFENANSVGNSRITANSRLFAALVGEYNDHEVPNGQKKVVDWKDPRNEAITGRDEFVAVTDTAAVLSKLKSGDQPSLLTLAEDVASFWTIILAFDEFGSVGDALWDAMLQGAFDDPAGALGESSTDPYPSVPDYPPRYDASHAAQAYYSQQQQLEHQHILQLQQQHLQQQQQPQPHMQRNQYRGPQYQPPPQSAIDSMGYSITYPDTASLRSPAPSAPSICAYFAKGYCRYGDSCFNRHELGSMASPLLDAKQQTQWTGHTATPPWSKPSYSIPQSATLCKYFLTPVGCQFGAKCRFSHATSPSANGTLSPLPTDKNGNNNGAAEEEDFDTEQFMKPDYFNPCEQCGGLPSLTETGLCHQCCFS